MAQISGSFATAENHPAVGEEAQERFSWTREAFLMADNDEIDVDEFMRQCLERHGIDIQAEYQERLADYTLNHAPRDYKAETERGDALRAAGLALPLCWIPEPQERWVQPPLPGKRDDG